MFRRFAIVGAILAAGCAAATAQGRPDTRAMSCGEVQALIAANGAAVLTTGRHTFDRFVAHRGFCMHLEAAVPISIATRDTDRCTVYRCRTTGYDGGFRHN